MKKVIIVFSIILLQYTIFANWINLNQSKLQNVTYNQNNRGNIALEFNLDGYNIEEIEHSGIKYSKISYEGEGKILEVGMPDLPLFSRLIAIPDQGTPKFDIISSSSHKVSDIKVYPQEKLDVGDDEQLFSINEEYYSTGECFPLNIVKISEPAIMRDLRVVRVSFYPFQYNAAAGELEIFDDISINISTSGSGGANTKDSSRLPSRRFTSLYSSTVLNYADFSEERDGYQIPSILYIYGDYNNVEANLEYLIDWKRKKGFEVAAVSTSDIGSTSALIKNYIQHAYDNWDNPPEYVVLVGDVSGSIYVPAWYEYWSGGNGIGDHPYSQLAGNDVLADIMIGRLSVNSNSELQTVIAKSINYEKDPYLGDPEWYNRAIMYAFGGPGKIATCNTVEQYLSYHNPQYSFSEIYYSNFVYQLNQAINNGAGFLCYRGQGVDDGWNNTQINSLNNGWMLPFAVFSTCYTNDFGGTSKTEAFLRAGVSSLPKGGIGAIGSSTGLTSGCFNNCITEGVFYGIFMEDIYSMGGALNRGKLNLYLQYPENQLNHVDCWSHCNGLMGDPSIELWTGTPAPLNVSYSEEIAEGTNYLEVTVFDDQSNPYEGAWVTANLGEEYSSTTYTDINGICYINLEGTELNQEYDLTVTAHNKIPHEGNFSIITADQNPVLQSVIFLDSDDNIPNPGDEINLQVTFHNTGSDQISDLQAELISLSDDITIDTNNTTLGNLAGNGEITNSDLSFAIDVNNTGNLEAQLMLELTSNEQNWQIPVFVNVTGAVLNITECHAIDANGMIDPGETVNIYFTVENMGQLSASDVTGEMQCSDIRLNITDNTGNFGDIDSFETGNNQGNYFQVSADNLLTPGTQIPIGIDFSFNGMATQTAYFTVIIGEVNINDPLGPDEYGYMCYDDEDVSYYECPEYEWIEINTIGNELPLSSPGDQASIHDVSLPQGFSFNFYGENYDNITVASSGWIAPGGTDAACFMNWQLPGPGGPNPMIAAFWDDMHYGYNSDIYSYYDSSEHIFIIEWDHLQNENNNQEETFQIILYDSNEYVTSTGDSQIKIQYKVVNNSNTGIYPYHGADHGMFSTIGLEDPTGTIGLQYTYNDTYPVTAKPLENQMAILFTPPAVPDDAPFLVIDDFSINSGGDQFCEAGEDALISLDIANLGGLVASDIEIELTTNDQYITINDANAITANIFPSAIFTFTDEFSISIADDVPDFYSFSLDFILTSTEGSWFRSIDLTAYHANILEVAPEEIIHEINWGEADSTSFEITNTGNTPIHFYLRTEETSQTRDITGSYMECSTESFTPGETTEWTFTAHNNAADNEWVSDIWVQFPYGVTVLSVTDFTGGSGGSLFWDGNAGVEPEITWHGETSNGWGVLHGGETASCVFEVQLSTQFAGDIEIDYLIEGDGYGEEPHQAGGVVVLEYPLRWIGLNMSSDIIMPQQSQEIIVYFDTIDVPEIEQNCNIFITTNSWDAKTIPVTLNPSNNPQISDEVANTPLKLNNYPNPFNPETTITFTIDDDCDNVIINIYNLKGQLINCLYNAPAIMGTHNVEWNGKDNNGNDTASGVYLYKVTTKQNSSIRKMLLLR